MDSDGTLKLKMTVQWQFNGNILDVGVTHSPESLVQNMQVDSVDITEVVLKNPSTEVKGLVSGNIWRFTIPNDFALTGEVSLIIKPLAEVTIDGQQKRISGEVNLPLNEERYLAIMFQVGHNAFLVVRNRRGQDRYGSIRDLQRIANVAASGQELYRWEDLQPMTDEHYDKLAILAGISGLLDGVVESDASIGKAFLKQQYKEMEASSTLNRAIRLNATNMAVASNIKGAIEFLIPDPGENYRSAQAEMDKALNPNNHPLVRTAAVAGVFGFSIMLVADFIPGVGKADDAVKAVRHGDQWVARLLGQIENDIGQARKLSQSDKFSQEARQAFVETVSELERKAESLRKLRDDLNNLDLNNLPDEELSNLTENMVNLETAQHHYERVKREAMRDFSEGVISASELMARRTEAAETMNRIMRSMPEEAASAKLKKIFEESSELAQELDQNTVIQLLRSQGKLTEEGIERFGRNMRNFYSEVGKVELRDKFALGPLNETRDLGIEGKRFEEIIMKNTPYEIGQDLNQIRGNFEVVDYVTRVSGSFSAGKIYSVARGGPEYMIEKIFRLFNRLEDDVNSRKFRNMLTHLSENHVLRHVSENPSPQELALLEQEFLARAYLLVPSDLEDPLKALILSRTNIPEELRERMANAVTSTLRR